MNKNSVTKSSCLFSKMKFAVKITRSPNCTENLEVYFGRLASYRHWLKVITFLRRFLEKVQMRRLTLFKISDVHSHNPGVRILRVLPVKSKQTFPNASRKRPLLHSEAAGGGWLLPRFPGSRAGATTEATPAGVGEGPGVWRLHAPPTWACAPSPPSAHLFPHRAKSAGAPPTDCFGPDTNPATSPRVKGRCFGRGHRKAFWKKNVYEGKLPCAHSGGAFPGLPLKSAASPEARRSCFFFFLT